MTSFFDEIQQFCGNAPAAETLEDILAATDGAAEAPRQNAVDSSTLMPPTLRTPIQVLVSQPLWAQPQPPTIGYFIPTDSIHQSPPALPLGVASSPVQEGPNKQPAFAFKKPSKKRLAPEDAPGDVAADTRGKRVWRGRGKAPKAAVVPTRTSIRRKEQEDQAQMDVVLHSFSRLDPRYRFFIHSVVCLSLEHSIDISDLQSPVAAPTIAELLNQTVSSLELLPRPIRPKVVSTAVALAEKKLLELPLTERLERAQLSLCLALYIMRESQKQVEEDGSQPEGDDFTRMYKRRVQAALGEDEEEDSRPKINTQQQQVQQQQAQQQQVPAAFVKQPWKKFVLVN